MVGQRLTQILQTYLDLKLHLLLDANHLFGAAHLPDALIACLYHLGQGGHVRSACQVFPATTVTGTSSLIEVPVLSSAQSGTKWDTLWGLEDDQKANIPDQKEVAFLLS